jgi:hypothetical protein
MHLAHNSLILHWIQGARWVDQSPPNFQYSNTCISNSLICSYPQMKNACIHQHNVKQSTLYSLCMLPLNIPLIAIWTWRRCNPFATPQFLPKKQQEMQGMIRNNNWKRNSDKHYLPLTGLLTMTIFLLSPITTLWKSHCLQLSGGKLCTDVHSGESPRGLN